MAIHDEEIAFHCAFFLVIGGLVIRENKLNFFTHLRIFVMWWETAGCGAVINVRNACLDH